MLKIFEPLSDSADINYNLAIKNCQNGIMSNGDMYMVSFSLAIFEGNR